MIWSREDYIAHMNFEYTGKEMFCELFGMLVGLDREWKAQGATPEELDLSAFGWDSVKLQRLPVHTGLLSGIVPRVLEDTPEYTISIDAYGRKVKLFKNVATVPLPIEYPVCTADDWEKMKPWYEFSPQRVDRNKLLEAKRRQENGTLTIMEIPGGFDEPRMLMGEEALCYAYYEQPELIRDMMDTFRATAAQVCEQVLDVLTPDCLFAHEDLAGKSGPLIGPTQVTEFIKPYYRGVWDLLSGAGCRIFSQDSDGFVEPVIDAFLDCGVTAMHPCEPAAGMDIVKLRQKYGERLAFQGGIDKHVLRSGTKEDIRRELEYKMCDITKGGGTIFALDHRIPNGTSLENYRYYVKLGREILGLPPAEPAPHVRMVL